LPACPAAGYSGLGGCAVFKAELIEACAWQGRKICYHSMFSSPAVSNTHPSNFALAVKDLKDGILAMHIWAMLGWQEIRQRYRRSVLGPFWITISTATMIAGMGPLYSRLFGQQLSSYFPYLTVSFVVWLLIANLINDCANAFILNEAYIKQLKLPLSIHILRVVWKNLILFFHNLLIVFVVLAFLQPPLGWHLLQMPLGVLIIALNALWFGILIGALCARFRDIPPTVASMVQVVFFLTPIIWQAESLGKHMWAAQINPIYHFIEIIRAPIVGGGAKPLSWAVVIAITVLGYGITVAAFSRFRARIAYWV
jgi:ABC-type polysaccharide/polyol phosphate export permease